MRVPLSLKIAALTVGTTAFYTLVGQLVPQKEIYPPKESALKKEMTADEMVKAGREVMDNKGLCFTCHTIGKKEGPFRFPDLEGVDVRAKTREPGLSDVEYFAQAMYEPNAFIVPGFNPGMPTINKPPIGLTDQEILCVIAYLQTLGGTASVTLQTKHHYNAGTATAAQAPAEGAPPAAPGAQGSTPPAPPAASPKGATPR